MIENRIPLTLVLPDSQATESRGDRNVRLLEKIGAGRHGEAYTGTLEGEAICVKRFTDKPGFFSGHPAKQEFERAVLIRKDFPELGANLQFPLFWEQHSHHGPILVSKLVQDFDGTVSKNLERVTTVTPSFVERLKTLLDAFIVRSKLLSAPAPNILVQRLSPETEQPVLIDVTNYENYRHYPLLAVKHALLPGSKTETIRKWAARSVHFAQSKLQQFLD